MPLTTGFMSRQELQQKAEPPKKKKKPPYKHVLYLQKVPMDIAAIDASMSAANS